VPAPLEDRNCGYLALIVAYGALKDLLVLCVEIFVSFHHPILELVLITKHLSQRRLLKLMEGVSPLRVIKQLILLLNSSIDISCCKTCITFHMFLI